MNPDYESKTVLEWMHEMYEGKLALTDFQRSHVWSNSLSAKFLTAILQAQPTGTILLVEAGKRLGRREIAGNNIADITKCENLILDGQQRLTSIWRALIENEKGRFFVQTNDLKGEKIEIEKVAHRSTDPAPQDDFAQNCVPLTALYDPPVVGGLVQKSNLRAWCEKVSPDDAKYAGDIEVSISNYIRDPLHQHKIWFARFTEIGVDEAATIFTETNSSSVKVTAFDFAVAQALHISKDFRFRERIQTFWKNNQLVRHYFHQDLERWVPEIGEWLLKIACLKLSKNGLTPKNGNFPLALEYLFDNGTSNLGDVEDNIVATLEFLEDNGVPTKDILPRIPPVYVIAALQDEIIDVDEVDKLKVRTLLSTYLWRSFFSKRYEQRANDRLHADFKSLRRDIERIKNGQHLEKSSAPVFRTRIVTKAELSDEEETFKSRTSMGNAVIALTLCDSPVDWMTGDPLSANRIRQIDSDTKLDRHHVFPKKALTDGDDGKGKDGLNKENPFIHHGLNIVLTGKITNIKIGGKKPAEYLMEIRENNQHLTDAAFKAHIESHLGIPYETLTCPDDKIVSRYRKYLKERADVLWNEIDKKANLPEGGL
ncbi:MAG: DUF262 domain-containing protein [Chloroflexi bacterium]|nr:DUF262 domain-containing protein [Chloroflexota bacterium]